MFPASQARAWTRVQVLPRLRRLTERPSASRQNRLVFADPIESWSLSQNFVRSLISRGFTAPFGKPNMTLRPRRVGVNGTSTYDVFHAPSRDGTASATEGSVSLKLRSSTRFLTQESRPREFRQRGFLEWTRRPSIAG